MSESAPNFLFIVPAKVRRGPGCKMPAHMTGALVDCFVAAPDHLSAVKIAAAGLGRDGHIFEDLVDGKVHQIDPQKWQSSIQAKWPEYPDHFPSQSEVLKMVATGGVFFGPFVGWEYED